MRRGPSDEKLSTLLAVEEIPGYGPAASPGPKGPAAGAAATQKAAAADAWPVVCPLVPIVSAPRFVFK